MLLRAALCVCLVTSTAAAAEPRIAVLEFEGSGDSGVEGAGKALQLMLTTDLAKVPTLKLVERDRLRDVVAELKLARRGLVDKTTAARIGKLAGATHLVAGSYVVAGPKMRLDSRVFAVEDGQVLMAEKIEGDKEAFFELEQALARKLVEALGIKLAPRERAALAKVHTADFEAFRKFGLGLAAFDEKRYDEALAALGDATRLDRDFQLAAKTLEDYERLISELRGQAEAIVSAQEAERERQALAQQAAQSEKWAPTIQTLWAIAGGKSQQDRIAATYLLLAGYRHRFHLRFPRGDAFALDRTADELEKRYVAEASPLFPRIPPIYISEVWDEPGKGEPVEAWVRKTWVSLEEQMKGYRRTRLIDHLAGQISSCRSPGRDHVVDALQLDMRGTLKFCERLLEWGTKLDESGRFRARVRDGMAELYREALELERSTAYLTEESRDKKADAHALRALAKEIDQNREMLALLQKSRSPLAREVLALGSYNARNVVSEYFAGANLSPLAHYYLAGYRDVPSGRLHVGPHPIWLVRAGHGKDLVTGPRVDASRTEEIRYAPDEEHRQFNGSHDNVREALMVVDGRPRADVRFRMKTSFVPAADWWPPGANDERQRTKAVEAAKAARPEVGVAFGITHARSNEVKPAMYALLFGAEGARLARVQLVQVKDATRINGIRTELQATPIEVRPWRATGDRLDLDVTIKGSALTVKASGQTLTFKAPADRYGFTGVVLRGPGYAGVSGFQVGAP